MARPHNIGGKALKFTPSLVTNDVLSKKMKISVFSPYKLALFAHDLTLAFLTFGLGAWITGLSFSGILFLLSLMIIAFFPTYNLYSYHLIFFQRKHFVNLLKSFVWTLLTYGIMAIPFILPHNFDNNSIIIAIFIVTIGFMLISRFMWAQLLNLIKAIGMSFIVLGTIGLISSDEIPIFMTNWLVLPISFTLSAGMVLVSRQFLVQVVFNKWMRRYFRRQVAIVGSDEEAKKIGDYIIDYNAPFWVAGIVGANNPNRLEVSVPKYQIGELRNLPLIVEQMKIDEIIVTDENLDKITLVSLLDYCISEGLTVWFPPKLMPIIDTKLFVDNFCGLPMIRLCSQNNMWIFNKIKHGLDAIFSLMLFVLVSPLLLAIAVAIKLNSRGPVFYRAQAVGKNGRLFTIYKFRSMKVDITHEIHKNYVTKLIKGEISIDENKKDQVLKITDDPRVTSVGKFIRRFSLDELPQLINVLKGEMSLVGPRPCLPYEYEVYKSWHKKRVSVRPGITGLWQVVGRSTVTFEDMILLDLYYIYNRSLLMDMNILYETSFVVFKKRGAY